MPRRPTRNYLKVRVWVHRAPGSGVAEWARESHPEVTVPERGANREPSWVAADPGVVQDDLVEEDAAAGGGLGVVLGDARGEAGEAAAGDRAQVALAHDVAAVEPQ